MENVVSMPFLVRRFPGAHKSAAIKLIEFLASPNGSRGIAGPTFEFPLTGVGGSTYLKGMTKFTPDNVSISQLSALNPKAIQLMAQAGWQ